MGSRQKFHKKLCIWVKTLKLEEYGCLKHKLHKCIFIFPSLQNWSILYSFKSHVKCQDTFTFLNWHSSHVTFRLIMHRKEVMKCNFIRNINNFRIMFLKKVICEAEMTLAPYWDPKFIPDWRTAAGLPQGYCNDPALLERKILRTSCVKEGIKETLPIHMNKWLSVFQFKLACI